MNKQVKKYNERNFMKFSRSNYSFREIQEMYFTAGYKNLRRRNGIYFLKYKDRVFHRNMVDGLCFGKFYGRDKVIFKRKNI